MVLQSVLPPDKLDKKAYSNHIDYALKLLTGEEKSGLSTDGKMHMRIIQRKFFMGLRSVIMLILLTGLFIPGEIRADLDQDQAKLQVLQSLNLIAVSLTHILTYNDKVVLDQEYNTIINNLNLGNIPDADIIALLQELMDLLTNSKIQDHERDYLLTRFDKNVQTELKNRMRSRIFDTDLVLNPYAGILKSVLYTGSFYFNYRSQMDSYTKEKEEGKWEIEAKTMQGFNSFYKKLLKYSWDLMRRYDLPDEWRLNEKQLRDYTDILKEPDLERRYRKLERIENSFRKFPPYWYYRGQAAQEIGNHKEAMDCFNEFQQINQKILRKDPYAASVAMCKTMLKAEQSDPGMLKRDLDLILANSDDADWGNILFAALQYGRMGDRDTTGKLILRNLDNGHTAFIDSPDMIRAVGPALLLNARPDVFNRIMDMVMENDKVNNYDLLWLYGEIRNSDILKKIQPEFDRVLLQVADKSLLNPLNVFKGDNITLFLPTGWMAENSLVTLRLKNEAGEKDFYPDNADVMPDFPEMTVLTFKDILTIKSFIKKKSSAQISISFIREKLAADNTEKNGYDIEMVFKSQIIRSDEQLSKTIKYTHNLYKVDAPSIESERKKQDSDELTIWFNKEKIILNGEVFGWNDEGVTKANTGGNLKFLISAPSGIRE
jgi:tetratricopeptide (TPR) repeat protein